MERWRTYFAAAEGDIWTVIQQAISIAAMDFPTDFRERRGEIAETLFARNLLVMHSELNTLGKRELESRDRPLSMEPIYDHCNDDATPLKRAAVYSNNRDGVHENHHQNGETSLAVVGEDASLVRDVNGIKASITGEDQSENIVVEALRRLRCLQMTVGMLKATEIGKQVKLLKKHPAKRVRALVKELMRDWKVIVNEWAASNAADGSIDVMEAGSGDHRHVPVKGCGIVPPKVDNVPPVEQAEAMSMDLSKLFSFMDDEIYKEDEDCHGHPTLVEPWVKDNSNYLSSSVSGSVLTDASDFDTKATTNHLWRHPTPEERGSATRDVYPSYAHYSNHEKQSSFLKAKTGYRDKAFRDVNNALSLESSKGMPGVSNPGQSCYELERREQTYGGGAVRQMHSVQKPVAVPGSNVNDTYLSVPDHQKSEKIEVNEKLEVAKRKLHQGYQQAENAKKQRTVQVLNFQDGLKAGQHAKGKAHLPMQKMPNPPVHNKVMPLQSIHGSQNRRLY